MTGVTVRTLHYYDEIGLLKPSLIKENGYRFYGKKELLTLQQILFYRELEFPLEDIAKIMKSKNFNRDEALKEQRRLLELKRDRLTNLINTLDETLKGGETMNTDDLFKSFGDDQLLKYQEEAKTRWGNSDAYRQSIEKVKKWTKKDYEEFKKKGKEFTKELAQAMDRDIKSPEVQALVEKHRQGIEYFYECSPEMYRNLADMYVNDPRFTKYYDKHKSGLAKWLRDAIYYYCDQKSQ